MQDQSAAPQWLLDTHKMIQDAEGFIIVTPEYNSTLPPALTNILDYFPLASYRHKPASIASYSMGAFGGCRASTVARPFLSELGLVTLPSVLTIPNITGAGIEESGEIAGNERVEKNSNKLCKELIWYVETIRAGRERTGGNPN